MEKTSKIAAGIVVMAIGTLIALCEYRHALFLTGCFIALSGIGVIVETIEKDERWKLKTNTKAKQSLHTTAY